MSAHVIIVYLVVPISVLIRGNKRGSIPIIVGRLPIIHVVALVPGNEIYRLVGNLLGVPIIVQKTPPGTIDIGLFPNGIRVFDLIIV